MADLGRFWSKVDRTGGVEACWPWLAGHNPRGAGIAIDPATKKSMVATRLLWRTLHGEIPAGLHVCHHCDNPACVNPKHLFLGTRSDNMRDMFQKGRGDAGRRTGEPRHKLSWDDGLEIRRLAAQGVAIREIARRYGVWASTIRKVVQRDNVQ